jgi:hypothetical protein
VTDRRLPALGALRSWLNSWRGIGAVERGMAHQGYDLQLTRYDARGWRATFYTTGMEHSITSATASAWERTPRHAVQGAAGRRCGGPRTRALNEPHQIVGGGCTGLPGGTPLRSALTKKGAEHLSASFRRFVYVAGWPWRAVRRALRKARWNA